MSIFDCTVFRKKNHAAAQVAQEKNPARSEINLPELGLARSAAPAPIWDLGPGLVSLMSYATGRRDMCGRQAALRELSSHADKDDARHEIRPLLPAR
jgi:hypothetical protein